MNNSDKNISNIGAYEVGEISISVEYRMKFQCKW